VAPAPSPVLFSTQPGAAVPHVSTLLRRVAGCGRSRSPLPKSWAKRRDLLLFQVQSKGMHGECEHCGQKFSVELLHCGFGECCYGYCERCGNTAILSGWSKQWPKDVKCTQAEMPAEMELHLRPCECRGRFAKGASPRCPHCKQSLSADKAAEWIEAQSPGVRKGWRWQRNWHGLYCVVVQGHRVADNFTIRDGQSP
jgi:hypothetical protein